MLHWPDGAGAAASAQEGEAADARLRLTAGLARAAIEFLASPARERLRACPAPRCVRYFVKDHPRQEWCKPSCGNRARVARHYQRHTTADSSGAALTVDDGRRSPRSRPPARCAAAG